VRCLEVQKQMYRTDWDTHAYRENRSGNTRLQYDTLWRPAPFNLAFSWHGSLDGHHMRRLILAGHRGSNGTGHCERWITGFTSTLPFLWYVSYRSGCPVLVHAYAEDVHTRRRLPRKLSVHG